MKFFSLFSVLCGVLLLASGASGAPAAVCVYPSTVSGLVLAMNMNMGAGTVVTDRSGAGNNGTISGATWTVSGKYGNGLSFDGVNDWVTVLDANSLDFTTGLTLEAWVFPTALAGGAGDGWRVIALKEGGVLSYTYALYANVNPPSVPRGYVAVGTVDGVASGTEQLALNVWTHVAFTYDGANLRFYINGVQVAVTARTGDVGVGTGPLRIGGSLPFGEFFAGRIDEVRMYNRALSAAEIVADRDLPIP